jgi:hypothetical protein
MKTIEISDELFLELQKHVTGFYVRPEDVIWRFIKKESQDKVNANNSVFIKEEEKQKQYVVYSKGGMIPCPLKLRMKYQGTITCGETMDGWIWFENQKFKSPSKAANYVARMKGVQNPSINGWTTIEYLDKDSDRWEYLKHLRDETAKTKSIEVVGSDEKAIVENVKKRKPRAVIVMNKRIDVKSWRDVKVVTFNQLLEKYPGNNLAGYLTEKNCGHTPIRLRNGKYTEVNRSAEEICRHCREAVKACDLTIGKDWAVELH